MNRDLKLTGNNFSNAASATYIAALIIEIPIGSLLIRISHLVYPLADTLHLKATSCKTSRWRNG
jgi:hypothetical protein